MQDLEGRYLYFNGAAARYGVTAGEIVRRTPQELFDPETADVIMDQIRKVGWQGSRWNMNSESLERGRSVVAEQTLSRP